MQHESFMILGRTVTWDKFKIIEPLDMIRAVIIL